MPRTGSKGYSREQALLVLCWAIDLSFTSFGTSAQSEIFPFLEAVRNPFPMVLVKYASVFLEGKSITHALHYQEPF